MERFANMQGVTSLVLLSSLVVSCFGYTRVDSELKSVIVVHRHGERNIIETYPSDPYDNIKYWPEGFGQLTTKGKMHHYLLGQWFRRRYNGFIPTEYNPDHIRVESTAVDRTFMSAGAHLSGLYPPPDSQRWDDALDWQPIPIHSKLKEEDAKLGARKACPRYEELYNLNWKQILDSNKALKEKIDNVTEIIHDVIGTGFIKGIDDLLTMYDVLTVETENGYKLPDWTQKIYPDALTELAKVRFTLEVYTTELAKLKIGLLLNELVGQFRNVSEPNGNVYPKYRIYSAHDFTIANIMLPLGLSDGTIPSYASALIFELRQDKMTKANFVNVLFKNSTRTPIELTIKGCDFDCDWDKFKATLQPIVMEDQSQWEAACHDTRLPEYLRKNTRTRTMMELE